MRGNNMTAVTDGTNKEKNIKNTKKEETTGKPGFDNKTGNWKYYGYVEDK